MQLAFAVAALGENRSEDARASVVLARRYAPPPAALEELLEACVDAQRNRIEDAQRRLDALDTAAGADAWKRATPGQKRVLRFLTLVPALKDASARFDPPR
jgi:hypothetical protein